jgi:hypothetical protein
MSVLSGGVVDPAVCGVTFIAPDVLIVPPRQADPAAALVRAYVDAQLDFAFAASWEPWAATMTGLLRDANIATFWVVPGVLWPALETVGVGEGLRISMREPGLLAPHLDRAAEAMLRAVATGVGLGADAIVVADDMAGEAGPLVSPDFVSTHVLPRLKRAVEAAAGEGVPVLLHSDGDISALLPGCRDAGFAGVHACVSGEGAFERVHAHARGCGLAVLGGLSTRLLADGLSSAVLAGTRLAILAQSGGLLVADDGGITTLDEYAALCAAFAATRV